MDSVVCFVNTYPLDSDLSGGQRYPAFEQPGPDLYGLTWFRFSGQAANTIRNISLFNLSGNLNNISDEILSQI